MATDKKKTYTKPRVKTQKIELGVYGDYGGDEVRPTTPQGRKDYSDGTNLDH